MVDKPKGKPQTLNHKDTFYIGVILGIMEKKMEATI